MKRRVAVLLVFMAFGYCAFLFYSTRIDRDIRSASIGRLYMLGMSLRQYAISHEGRFPDKFGELHNISPKLLVSPASGRKPGSMSDVDSWSDYKLIKGRKTSDPPEEILAYGKTCYWRDNLTIALYVNGEVKVINIEAIGVNSRQIINRHE